MTDQRLYKDVDPVFTWNKVKAAEIGVTVSGIASEDVRSPTVTTDESEGTFNAGNTPLPERTKPSVSGDGGFKNSGTARGSQDPNANPANTLSGPFRTTEVGKLKESQREPWEAGSNQSDMSAQSCPSALHTDNLSV